MCHGGVALPLDKTTPVSVNDHFNYCRIAEQGVDCVLAEPQFNPGLVDTVLEGTEAKTGILDPLGSDLEPGPALYPQLIRNLSTALAGCM